MEERAPDGARVRSHCGRQNLFVVELLGGQTLDEIIAVVESLEVNLDDISTGVVDPHVLDSNHRP